MSTTSTPTGATSDTAEPKSEIKTAAPTSAAHGRQAATLFEIANLVRSGHATATLSTTVNPDGSYEWTGSGNVPAPATTP